MKNLAVLFFLILTFSISNAQEEWSLIHPYPTLNNLIDSHFISEQKGWVVGTDGLIMFTEDGGETWDIQHSNDDESFWSIFFIDDNEGWVVGWSSIYHTTNSGETWEYQNHPSVLGDLTDVFFTNHDTGWIVGTYKIILKTTDGGENWTKIMNTLTGDNCFYSVSFTDELHGCAVGGKMSNSDLGFIMITNDGGLTWNETTPLACNKLNNIFFSDSVTAWTCGYNGELRKTLDGGNTWINKSFLYNSFDDIHFFDDNHGLLLVSGYKVQLTQDGGETWDSTVYINGTSSQRSFSSFGDNQGITVGFHGSICKTLDRGNSWENLNDGISSTIYQMGFFNSLNGLAITGYWGDGDLIRTNDGGYNWYNDTLIENGPFYRLRIYGTSCYLLNSSSQMMKTTNCGEEWELLDVPDLTDFYFDLQFVNENTAYMCSSEGIIVKTNNGGITWIDKSISDEYNLNSLFFINENKGWFIDYTGKTILRTTTGGDDWTFTTLGDVYIFQPESIFFISENEGFATTGEGVIFKTIDGGDTWEEFYVFGTGMYSKIYFLNENEGWYKSNAGIYHTYDGGISWINGQSFSYTSMKGLFFLNDNQGWLCGGDGLVASYNSTVGINEFNENTVSVFVFPNPAHDDIEIKLHDKSDKINDIKLFNIQGQQLRHFANLSEINSFKFDISSLISGAYILHLSTEKRQNLVKFIVQ